MKQLHIPQNPTREQLTKLINTVPVSRWDFSDINSDIRIDDSMRSYVINNEHVRSTMDCAGYCFGRDYASTPEIMNVLYATAQKDDHTRSTLVWYLQNGSPVHVGKLLPNNHVKSKWGRGHVITHPLDVVPDEFGDVVEFSQDVSEYELSILWTPYYFD